MELYADTLCVCPTCGYVEGTPAEEAVHMEPGTLLHDRYIVGRVLGYGGFGVTYIGWDGRLEQKVAIKEYLPSEFSTRMPGRSQVTVFNGDKSEQFHDGLHKFVEEARRLAKFQNEPGIVKIFDSFEENDTAYIVMEYLDGETLTSYLKRNKTVPGDWAVQMLTPLMESLQVVHAEGLLHRDIAPDNVFLTRDGQVKLIDFGASRYATTSHSRSLTVIIKPGYSPEEQYRSRGDQGPYTDVYALAATLYKMMTGKTAPDAMERRAKYESQNKDILEEPRKLNKHITRNHQNAILNAMNVRIEDRTQDVGMFLRELNADPPVKRRYGKIKKLDLYSWPLWAKVTMATVLSLVLLLGGLLVTGVIDYNPYSSQIVIPENVSVVPDVEGLYQDEAVELIQSKRLLAAAGGTVESEYIPAGKIVFQSPTGGAYMGVNQTVVLTVSSGSGVAGPVDGIATVPYLVWETEEDAKTKLRAAGLGVPTVETAYDENVAEGLVVSQSMSAGEKVAEDTVMTLVISLGPAPFDMPNVYDMTQKEAETLLTEKGLIVHIEYEKSNEVQEDHVIRQSVSTGNTVKRGDEITIVVCSGKATIHIADVTGKTRGDAEAELKKQGFKVTVLENYDTTVPSGNVISQTPGAGTAQLPGSEVTIYVSKGRQPVSVTLDANGGSVTPDSVTVYHTDEYDGLPTPSRTGYSFQGWYTDKSGGAKVTETTTVSTSSAHTLYARWSANTYTVSLDACTGAAITGKSVVFGETYGSLYTPVRDGYNFLGWFTAKSGGTQVSANDTMTTGSNHTLYAQWSVITYTVTLNGNGGNNPGNITVEHGGRYGALPTPTRNGYTFQGWFTAQDGGEEITSGGTKVIITNSNHTLYAHWVPTRYVVTLDANGGSGGDTREVTFGAAYGDLPAASRQGYSFEGWFTAKSGGSKVTASTTVNTASNHTLYAQWTEAKVTVSFDANGGKVSPSSMNFSQDGTYTDLPTPTWEGYTFLGWYDTTGAGAKQITKGASLISNNPHSLYARWEKTVYLVRLETNGGRLDGMSGSINVQANYGAKLGTPERAGYDFDGWYTAAEGGTQFTTITQNMTLYAHWTKKTVSDWVLASEAPTGAEIVDQRWVYDAVDRVESSSSSLEGYTLEETRATYTDWTAWSGWSVNSSPYGNTNMTNTLGDEVVQVESRVVTDQEGYTQYRYWRYKLSGGNRIHWCETLGKQYWGGSWYQDYTGWSSERKGVYDYSYGRCGCHGSVVAYGTASNLYYWEESRWIEPVTHTEFNWRERSIESLTYIHIKVEQKESTEAVVESDTCTNVQHWVRYKLQ